MKPVRVIRYFDLRSLIIVFLFSKGADSGTAKVTELTKSDTSHSKVNVHRNDPLPERAPTTAYLS